jgi:hypothetical protein
MEITEEDVYKIYKQCYKTENSKGKIKQVVLNDTVIEIIKRSGVSNVTFKTEHAIKDVYGNTFKVDIAVYDEEDNLVQIYLLKAPASNIKQNYINFLNAQSGEFNRPDRTTFPNLRIHGIMFLPNTTPYFRKDESIKNFEKNDETVFLTESDPFYKFDIEETHVKFDIEGIEVCTKKEEINNLFIETNPIRNIKVSTSSFKRNE